MIPALKKLIRNVSGYQNIILVWDDYVREQPVDFDEIQKQIDHKLIVVKHTDLDPWPQSIGHWGWIKQQLVKLSCYRYSTAPYTWIVDGDVLITQDPELFVQGLPALRYDQDRLVNFANSEYHDFIKKYFKINDFLPYTWVGSSCLFDNKICEEIWNNCQQLNNKSLIECVDETISPIQEHEKNNHWPFSEFELYGSYCYHHHREKFHVTQKNWNYAPTTEHIDWPIQIMWNQFDDASIDYLLKK